jgi:signal transduction histidine kinase
MSSESRVSTIAIRTTMENSKVRLSVSDTGPGFRSTTAAFVKGIGLSNTESRLAQLYGSAHEIEYAKQSGAGASVTISIPFQEAVPAGPHEVRM